MMRVAAAPPDADAAVNTMAAAPTIKRQRLRWLLTRVGGCERAGSCVHIGCDARWCHCIGPRGGGHCWWTLHLFWSHSVDRAFDVIVVRGNSKRPGAGPCSSLMHEHTAHRTYQTGGPWQSRIRTHRASTVNHDTLDATHIGSLQCSAPQLNSIASCFREVAVGSPLLQQAATAEFSHFEGV